MRREKREPTYEERLLAFIDLLGFADLIKESEANPATIVKIARALRTAQRMAEGFVEATSNRVTYKVAGCSQQMFSDTIVLSCPCESSHALNYMVGWVTYFQLIMWSERAVFIRGSIVHGDLYDKTRLIFGPALLEAYCLERTVADWPRILVSNRVLRVLSDEERKSAFNEYLQKEDDGPAYIDYLRELFALSAYAEGQHSNRVDLPNPVKLIEMHKAKIIEAVNSLNSKDCNKRQSVLTKYYNLAKYHNSVIDILVAACNDAMALLPYILIDELAESLLPVVGMQYKTRYSVDDNPEYSNIKILIGVARHSFLATGKHIPHNDIQAYLDNHVEGIGPHMANLADSLKRLRFRQNELLRISGEGYC